MWNDVKGYGKGYDVKGKGKGKGKGKDGWFNPPDPNRFRPPCAKCGNSTNIYSATTCGHCYQKLPVLEGSGKGGKGKGGKGLGGNQGPPPKRIPGYHPSAPPWRNGPASYAEVAAGALALSAGAGPATTPTRRWGGRAAAPKADNDQAKPSVGTQAHNAEQFAQSLRRDGAPEGAISSAESTAQQLRDLQAQSRTPAERAKFAQAQVPKRTAALDRAEKAVQDTQEALAKLSAQLLERQTAAQEAKVALEKAVKEAEEATAAADTPAPATSSESTDPAHIVAQIVKLAGACKTMGAQIDPGNAKVAETFGQIDSSWNQLATALSSLSEQITKEQPKKDESMGVGEGGGAAPPQQPTTPRVDHEAIAAKALEENEELRQKLADMQKATSAQPVPQEEDFDLLDGIDESSEIYQTACAGGADAIKRLLGICQENARAKRARLHGAA